MFNNNVFNNVLILVERQTQRTDLWTGVGGGRKELDERREKHGKQSTTIYKIR